MPSGQVIDDRYEIVQPLGEGGFGNVFLAVQRGFDRQVALKILRNDLTDEETRKRFHREAKLLSMMHHPNIALFVGSGVWDQKQYTALEFVAGETLHQRLQQGRLNGAQIKELALGMLSGLAHAHAAGVIHRDLKPANIVVQQKSNVPKLIDFGLASTTLDQQKLTQEGCAIGTTLYMAPEQCMGQVLTPAADLYALGCILYQCTTGKAPFDADNAVAVMFKHLNETPPTILTKSEAEAQFVDWLDRLLEKEPSKRFATADDAMEALRTIDLRPTDFATISTSQSPPRRSFKWINWAWIAAPACTALLVLFMTFAPKHADNVNFGTPLSLLEAKLSDQDLSNVIDTRLNIIDRAVKESTTNGTETTSTFRDDIERELGEILQWTTKRKLTHQRQQVLGILVQLPWHATSLRSDAVTQASNINPRYPEEASHLFDAFACGMRALEPPATPQDYLCLPIMQMKAIDCAHLAGRTEDQKRMLDHFIAYCKKYKPNSEMLANALANKAVFMNGMHFGTAADRAAAARMAYESIVTANFAADQKAIEIIPMARVMGSNYEMATAVEYFDKALVYLKSANKKDYLDIAFTEAERAYCLQQLGRTKEAGSSLLEAEATMIKASPKSYLSHGWFIIGDIRQSRKEYAAAIAAFQKAIACAEQDADRNLATEHLKWCSKQASVSAPK